MLLMDKWILEAGTLVELACLLVGILLVTSG